MVIPIAIGKAGTKDLKSFGHCGLPPVGLREAAGSIPASGIHD